MNIYDVAYSPINIQKAENLKLCLKQRIKNPVEKKYKIYGKREIKIEQSYDNKLNRVMFSTHRNI